MVPPAPPIFSMTICWPSVRLMDSATRRVTVSVGPPAAAGTTMVIGVGASGPASFRFDPRRLDEGPPFLDFCLLQRAERLRRLLSGREHLLAKVVEALADRRLGQRCNYGCIELRDDLLGRALGGPQRVPVGEIKARQAGLVGGRNIGRMRHAALCGDRIGFDAAGADLRQALVRRG